MDPTLISLGALALAGAAATVSGCAEDLESDVGSHRITSYNVCYTKLLRTGSPDIALLKYL